MDYRSWVLKNGALTLQPATAQLLKSEHLQLDLGKWNINRMDDVCMLLEIWFVVQLNASFNGSKYFLKTVQDIKFFKLQKLSLFENNIQSIEGLSRIDMKFLKYVYLSQNRIISLKEFRKINWPVLNQLFFSQNLINQLSPLTYFYWFRKFMLGMDANYALLQPMQEYFDVTQMAKLKIDFLEGFYLSNKIEQENMMRTLQKKFEKLQV